MKEREKLFLQSVKDGQLKVTLDGTVQNLKTGRKIGCKDRHGYHMVGMRRGTQTFNMYIHRLVFMVYKGSIEQGFEINHIDGNKDNNHVSNLEKVTRRENILHGHRNGLYDLGKKRSAFKQQGHKSHRAKLTKEQVMRIRLHYSEGKKSIEDLASEYQVSIATISRVINKKTYNYKNL